MKILIVLAFTLLCSGCSNLIKSQVAVNDLFTPKEMLEAKKSDGDKKTTPTPALGSLKEGDLARMIFEGESDLNVALSKFDRSCSSGSIPQCRFIRNSVQDRLIASSNAICRDYKNYLKKSHAATNVAFGSLATIFGGVGAIVTSATPARLFAGAASVVTGVRAEVNQSMYSMLAIEIVTKAIDKGRQEILREIDTSQRKSIDNYSIERALGDAEEYHTRCSLLSGLQEASAAVAKSSAADMENMSQTLEKMGQSAKIQIGKRNFDLFGGRPVFVEVVCKSIRQEHEDYQKNTNINVSGYSEINGRWSDFYNKSGNCTPDSISVVDKEWRDLVAGFINTTDDQDREKFSSQIAAQQSKAVAYEKFLRDAAKKITGDLKNRQDEINKNIKSLRDDVASRYSYFSEGVNEEFTDADRKVYVLALQDFSQKIFQARNLIAVTVTPMPEAASSKIGVANEAALKLTESSLIMHIDAARKSVIDAYNSSTQFWVSK